VRIGYMCIWVSSCPGGVGAYALVKYEAPPGLGHACKVFLEQMSCVGWMSFLTPQMTHVGLSCCQVSMDHAYQRVVAVP